MSRLQSLTRSTPFIHERLPIRHVSASPQPSSPSPLSLIGASSQTLPKTPSMARSSNGSPASRWARE
ncbi:hypothetical protein ACFXTN_039893 [Malus domestica]